MNHAYYHFKCHSRDCDRDEIVIGDLNEDPRYINMITSTLSIVFMIEPRKIDMF